MPDMLRQVDVFGARPLAGNPVAVVTCSDPWTDERMQDFARWTNLSETTFLLEPTDPGADYRVRIFTPQRELPFAGHPTLGTAHAWLEAGGSPRRDGVVVQECGVGLVELRRDDEGLAFEAPELLRSGPVEASVLAQATASLGLDDDEVLAAEWVDNGPGWLGLVLPDAARVLSLRPDYAVMGDLRLGVLGAYPEGEVDVEVRAFVPSLAVAEDPVTGSLNAGFALWLTRAGRLPGSYVAGQGGAIGRDGRVRVRTDEGRIWVGGATHTVMSGPLTL